MSRHTYSVDAAETKEISTVADVGDCAVNGVLSCRFKHESDTSENAMFVTLSKPVPEKNTRATDPLGISQTPPSFCGLR